MSSPGGDWWRRVLRPHVLVPIVLSMALLVFALGISDLPDIASRLSRIRLVTILTVFGLACGYLIIKSRQLRLLLKAMDIRPSSRQFGLAFAIGEMTLPVPSGIYMQNYVLKNLGTAGFAHSAAATTVVLLVEASVVALSLAIIGVPGWSGLRPALAAAVLGGAAVLTAVFRSRRVQSFVERQTDRPHWGLVAQAILDFVRGVRSASKLKTLGFAFLLGAAYMAALVTSLWAVGRGIGLSNVSFLTSASIYFFSLGTALLLGGVFAQLGVLEVAGIGVARAWGYQVSDALAMLLAFRILWLGSIWLVCGVLVAALWREFREAHHRSEGSRSSGDGSEESHSSGDGSEESHSSGDGGEKPSD